MPLLRPTINRSGANIVAILGFLVLSTLIALGETGNCADPEPTNGTTIKETMEIPSQAVFTMSDPSMKTSWVYSVVSPTILANYFSDFFMMDRDSDGWKLKYMLPFDLESEGYRSYLDDKHVATFTDFTIALTCYDSDLKTNKFFSRSLKVEPVDEFPPVFNSSEIKINVDEETFKYESIISMRNFVIDEDTQVDSARDQQIFSYTPISFGAYYKVSTWGSLLVDNDADYEKGATSYDMLVSVENLKGEKSTTHLHIKIVNVNDNAPIFMYLGCVDPCVDQFYSADVSKCFRGVIYKYEYGPINAIDIDREPVGFRIIVISPPQASSFVRIDSNTGSLVVVRALAELKARFVTMAIEAFNFNTVKKMRYYVPMETSGFTVAILRVIDNC